MFPCVNELTHFDAGVFKFIFLIVNNKCLKRFNSEKLTSNLLKLVYPLQEKKMLSKILY